MLKPWDRLRDFLATRETALSVSQIQALELYIEELERYNKKVNLTADASRESLVLRHLADALACLPVLRARFPTRAPRLLDLGSGGGLIGIPLKIGWPEAPVTLLEPVKRKYDFLSWAAARLRLKGLRVVKSGFGEVFDAVVARALAPLPRALEISRPFTAEGGIFLCYQTEPADASSPRLAKTLAKTGAILVKSIAYRLPGEERERHLVLFER